MQFCGIHGGKRVPIVRLALSSQYKMGETLQLGEDAKGWFMVPKSTHNRLDKILSIF